MGCCCNEDDGDIFRHLMNPSSSSSSSFQTPSSSSSYTVISPMNSHFSALSSTDMLRTIFQKLPVPDLARASCVSRLWHSVASDRDILTAAFLSPWKLNAVVGNPLSGSFWRDNTLAKFAVSHRILRDKGRLRRCIVDEIDGGGEGGSTSDDVSEGSDDDRELLLNDERWSKD